MKQLTGQMSAATVELEMEIQALRGRLGRLEETVRSLLDRLSELEAGDPVAAARQ